MPAALRFSSTSGAAASLAVPFQASGYMQKLMYVALSTILSPLPWRRYSLLLALM
jgi:hypothetical protein